MRILGASIVRLVFHLAILISKSSYIKFFICLNSLQLSTKVVGRKVSSIVVIIEDGKEAGIDVNTNGHNMKSLTITFQSLYVVGGCTCK